jgi:hypothetical protein
MPSGAFLLLGDLKGGRLRLDNLPALTRWIQAQPDGARFRAQFERTDLPKRERLEKFYRYVLLPQAAEKIGYDRPEMHRVFYGSVFGIWYEVENPLLVEAIDSMSDFSLSFYVQDCVRIAAEQGCVIGEKP